METRAVTSNLSDSQNKLEVQSLLEQGVGRGHLYCNMTMSKNNSLSVKLLRCRIICIGRISELPRGKMIDSNNNIKIFVRSDNILIMLRGKNDC